MSLISVKRHIIEAYTTIDEKANIHGVALLPRISRNGNLYTKKELARFDNVTVPLNWEHDPSKVIGSATFHYNSEIETVFYDGEITDEAAASLARNKTLFTSIEAEPTSAREVCNGSTDCFSMPFGLIPKGLALTETPGVPETSVIVEHFYKECTRDKATQLEWATALNNKLLERTGMEEDEMGKILANEAAKKTLSNEQQIIKLLIEKDKQNNEKILKLTEQFKRIHERMFCPDCGKLR